MSLRHHWNDASFLGKLSLNRVYFRSVHSYKISPDQCGQARVESVVKPNGNCPDAPKNALTHDQKMKIN